MERLKRIATARSCVWSPTLTRRIVQCVIIIKEEAAEQRINLDVVITYEHELHLGVREIVPCPRR